MRVLHVFEPLRRPPRPWFLAGEGVDCIAEASLLSAAGCFPSLGASHEAIVLGGAREARWAARLGVPRPRTLCPTAGLGALASNTLHRYVSDCGPFRHVVCWSPRAAAPIGRRVRRICPVSTVDLREGVVVTTRPDGSRLSQSLSRRATPLRQSGDARPGWARRLRAKRGLSPATRVIGLLGNTEDGAVTLAHLLGILQVAGIDARGLVSKGSGGMRRARRLAQEGYPFIHRADVPASILVAACDLAILVTGESGPEAAWAATLLHAGAARGVPVIRRRGGDGEAFLVDTSETEAPADLARAVRRHLERGAAPASPEEAAHCAVPDLLGALRDAEVPA